MELAKLRRVLFRVEEAPHAVDVGLLLLRVGFGLSMLCAHGWPKFIHFSEKASVFPDPLGVGSAASLGMAVFAELICSALLVVGAGTRFVVVPLLVTMAVAFFIVHGADPFAKKELALTYLIPYLALLCTGAGRYSVDSVLQGKRLS